MLDGVNSVGANGKGGGSLHGFDQIDVGRDEWFVGKINSTEDEPIIFGSRLDCERYFLAGVKGGSFKGGGRGECLLHVGHE